MSRRRRIPRCHVSDALQRGAELTLERAASHHLLTVLRAERGDTLELFNGDGYDYQAELVETGKRARVLIRSASPNHRDSPLHSTLVQGISRGDRMDLTIQKCVELGLSHLSPVYTRRSMTPLDPKRAAKKQEHWRNVAISACEQCGRSRIPVIDAPKPLAEHLSILADTVPTQLACVLAPEATRSLLALCRQFRQTAGTSPALASEGATAGTAGEANDVPATECRVTLLVGPESGLDAEEIASARQAGYAAVRLGPRVLRTETAGLVAMTLVQAECGDLDAETDD